MKFKHKVKYTKSIFVSISLATLGLVGGVAFGLGFDPFPQQQQTQPQDPQQNTQNQDNSSNNTSSQEDSHTANPPNSNNGFQLQNPSNVKDSVTYDPDSNRYYFNQTVGGEDVKNPSYMTSDEFLKYEFEKDQQNYFKQRLDALDLFNEKPTLPGLTKAGIFDRLFGGNGITVKPQGNLDLKFGGSWQNIKNPSLTQRAQKYGIFDFDMNMNVNVLAQIGDKMKLNISNNTLTTFGQQNMQKLEYTGHQDEIIKKIEAGNISFPLRTSLITGVSSLFGVKLQTQWGRLWMTNVISQQKSQKKSMTLQGGATTQEFSIKISDYDENRNFLLGQYFYNHYNTALANYPVINSQVVLNKVEVWVTNRTGSTTNVRDVLAFQDIGEKNPYLATLEDPGGTDLPDNASNRLYRELNENSVARTQSGATQATISMGLTEGQDFQRSTMRKLDSTEYYYQPQLGYISIKNSGNADDIIAVAYRYTYNGVVHQVGEFASDISPDSTNPKVMFVKLLKGTSLKPKLPIWNLMMKNIYSLNAAGMTKDNFRLNILYQNPGGGNIRYIPDGTHANEPLISLLNLDRLNTNSDPYPDGVFDYVEGITVNSTQGKIMFPVIEPFGKDLYAALDSNPVLIKKYAYDLLYDSTKTKAQQQQQNNRFILSGNYKSASGSSTSLGFNIAANSVTVTAGGQQLVEGTDYQVDYTTGSIRILNEAILNSGAQITISYEDNVTFGQQVQNFMGTRLDYYFNDKLSLGATYMKLSERPYTQKVDVGDDPINNTMLGFDGNYQSESKWLTRALNKLPFYKTNAPSFMSLSGEIAGLFPGHSSMINIPGDDGGTVYIDNFEGANSSIDMKLPFSNWFLASTPVDARDQNNQVLFPEATSIGTLTSGYNRAKLAWYSLEPTLVDGTSSNPDNVRGDTALNDYWRIVQQTEVFPTQTQVSYSNGLSTLDLNFNPYERGPYNFDVDNIESDGSLRNPKTRWGGIQRYISNNSDFEASNVQYITFWLLDPYIYSNTSQGGYLYINLGNVSEDVLKDSRLSFENGIPYPKDFSKLDKTVWGYVPRFQLQTTRAFSNDDGARVVQDVGYDEMDDAEESTAYAQFLSQIGAVLGTGSTAYQKLAADPASDNYHYFRGDDYDQQQLTVLQRYKNFNNSQGNSPVVSTNSTYSYAATTYPESEDISQDNTLNETESYYQYRIKVEPNMQVGTNYINNIQTANVKLKNGRMSEEKWYQFKVPISSYDHVVGDISDFRAIRFMRLFMNGFADSSVIMRFAQLQLDRSSWQRYMYSLISPGENIPEEDNNTTSYSISTLSIEQNSTRQPIPYVIPPGIQRQQSAISSGQTVQQDEQSLSFSVCGLKDGDARAVFKGTASSSANSTDWRRYKQLKMFIHAEGVENQAVVKDGDIYAFVRIGSDFVNNYYEYRIPLKISAFTSTTQDEIWPTANELNITLADLVNLKDARIKSGQASYLPYTGTDNLGNTIIVVGNPSLGSATQMMMGVLNPKKTLTNTSDDGTSKCAEVWYDELRLVGIDQSPAYAATAQANFQLGDLGTAHISSTMHTVGWGTIDQNVSERSTSNYFDYNINSNLNLGKLLPSSAGLQIPSYLGYQRIISNPLYDPYNTDIKLKDELQNATTKQKDSIMNIAQDFTSVTNMAFNNIRYLGNPNAPVTKVMPWSLRNFDFSYAYMRQFKRNATTASDDYTDNRLIIGYAYTFRVKSFEPFKKIKSKSKWLTFIKDFNINPLPNSFTFRSNMHRVFEETILRDIETGSYNYDPIYYKNFTWNRTYALRWEFTKSLSFGLTASNDSRIDEPYGRLDTKAKKDSVLKSILQLGRNTYYSQAVNVSYNFPTKKFPILDWTTATYNYTSTFYWSAASLLTKSQGNTIGNTRTQQWNGQLNLTMLYNKSRWLRALNQNGGNGNGNNSQLKRPNMSNAQKLGGDNNTNQNDNKKNNGPQDQDILPPRPKMKKVTQEDVNGYYKMTPDSLKKEMKSLQKKEKAKYKKELAAWKAKRNAIVPNIAEPIKIVGRLATMLKNVNINYTETQGTILPGYMDSTRVLGLNPSTMSSGLFAFGAQPSMQWIRNLAQQGYMTKDSLFNGQMQQQYTRNINVTATLEPIPNFRIDLTWMQNFTKSHSEIFKYNADNNAYEDYNPYYSGSFSQSYIAIKTMFKPIKPNVLSESYTNFMNSRTTISRRLGSANPYTNNVVDPTNSAYAKGYGAYSQDVLIPAFIAAYTGKDPSKAPLMNYKDQENVRSNPFKYYFPLPNWKVTYTGLGKMSALQDFIANCVITHAYTGTMSMNSFTNNLTYSDLLGVGYPSFLDSTSGNYIPFFYVPNVTITESFSPLAGIELSLKNSMSFSVKYIKSRMVSLSLTDYQISETNSSEIDLGFGYRANGLSLPFAVFGTKRLKNTVNFRMTFALRNDLTTNTYMAQNQSIAVRGQKVIRIAPNIDYLINNHLQINFYYDRSQTIPYISTSYPIITTTAGFTLRFLFDGQ